MKITAPRITAVLKEDVALDEILLNDGEDLTEFTFRNQRVFEIKTKNISMQSCLFTNCMLIGCSIKKSQFSDIIFRNCDLSNVNFPNPASTVSSFTIVTDRCEFLLNRL